MLGTLLDAGDSVLNLGKLGIEHINKHECIIPNCDYAKIEAHNQKD